MIDIIKGIIGLCALILAILISLVLVKESSDLGNEIRANGFKPFIDRLWTGTNEMRK